MKHLLGPSFVMLPSLTGLSHEDLATWLKDQGEPLIDFGLEDGKKA